MISGLHHACPSCGVMGEFYTGDYFVPTATALDEVVGSTATMSGDQESIRKTELETLAGRMAGYGVQGGPSHPSEGPAPPYDSDSGE